MEGSYISSADARFQVADTIIFLDLPRLLCLWRVFKRHVTTYGQYGRPDIPEGCTDRIDLIRVAKILVFPHRGRKLLLEKIHAQEQHQREPKEIIFCSDKQIQAFLCEQTAKQPRQAALLVREVLREKRIPATPLA